MYQTIRYEKQDQIALVTIDRPEALNALNSAVITELEQVMADLEADREIRAMILTGQGRSFVAAHCCAALKGWNFPPLPR